jgi:hypothetical protein
MKSHPFFAINVAFATSMLVTAPSYYFCFKRREHKEATIEMMMQANDFQTHEEMPEEIPTEQHPFLEENNDEGIKQKEFIARLKEKKEWQAPAASEDVSKVFKEVKRE